MKTEAILLVALAVVAACVLLRVNIRNYRSRRMLREYERFRRDPQIGDSAGYCVFGRIWVVGKVVGRKRTDAAPSGWIVELERSLHGVFGESALREWRLVDDLEYFAPDTPLGQHEGKPTS